MKPYRVLDINQCPKCLGRLILFEYEGTLSDLNKNGIPSINGIVSDYDAKLVCSTCKTIYDAEKIGPAFHIAPKYSVYMMNKRKKIKAVIPDNYNPFLIEEN